IFSRDWSSDVCSSDLQGVSIPSSTMNNWTHQVAALIKPLAHQIQSQILQSNYIQMDESTIKVLFVKKDKTHKGYMWVMIDPQTRSEERRVGKERRSQR